MSDQAPQTARQKQQSIAASNFEGSFPCILYSMLDEVEAQGLAHVVSWQPHGRCFVVHKRRSFVETILPVYFRTTKFASFQRQLNLYGFHRLTTGQDRGGYYHDLFLRGNKDFCKLILRQQVKGAGPRKPDAPEQEPNFYEMEYMPGSNTDDQKMPSTSGRNVAISTSAAPSSLSGLMMESATRATQMATESALIASLYPTTSSSVPSLAVQAGASSVNPAFQYPQGLVFGASAQTGYDPVVAALRAAATPYYPFRSSLLPFQVPSSFFHQQAAAPYGFASSNFPLQSLMSITDRPSSSIFPSGAAAASMERPSLRDILQRDSFDSSIFNIAATQSQHRDYQQEQERLQQERSRAMVETLRGENRTETSDPSNVAPARRSRSDEESPPKGSARKRRRR